MSIIQAFILGIIQGITEFLPISSSGHLAIGQYLFGLTELDTYIVFDLICHIGTLCAILLVYSKEILSLCTVETGRLKQICIGTLPLFPIVIILKPIENLYNNPQLLGFFFIFTAFILYLSICLGYTKSKEKIKQHYLRDAFIIGLLQTVAILPGVSRSGSTISAARIIGWDMKNALQFSFLLAIPAILGGTSLKLLQMFTLESNINHSLDFSHYLAGFLSSFIVGYSALQLLIKLAMKEKFMYFVWYCLLLGTGLSIYFF